MLGWALRLGPVWSCNFDLPCVTAQWCNQVTLEPTPVIVFQCQAGHFQAAAAQAGPCTCAAGARCKHAVHVHTQHHCRNRQSTVCVTSRCGFNSSTPCVLWDVGSQPKVHASAESFRSVLAEESAETGRVRQRLITSTRLLRGPERAGVDSAAACACAYVAAGANPMNLARFGPALAQHRRATPAHRLNGH